MKSDKTLNNFKDKLLDKSFEITLGAISISAISYFFSRIFVKVYLEMIGFETLGYSALSNNDTSSLFFFGILMTLTSVVLLCVIIPICLRQVYLASEIQHENTDKKIINILIISSFLTVLISCIIFMLYKQEIWIFLPIAFPPITLFIYKYIKLKQLNFNQLSFTFLNTVQPKIYTLENTFQKQFIFNNLQYLIKYIVLGCLFALTSSLLIVPCILLVFYVNQSILIKEISNSDTWIISVASIIWISYSLIYGYRVSKIDTKHYVYDIIISFAFLYFLSLINIQALIIGTAHFVDIKDSNSSIYKIIDEDYDEISAEIENFWKKNYKDLEGYHICQPLTKSLNNSTFLQAQIIFRDSNIIIVCPPDIKPLTLGTEQCFIADKNKLLPTSKSMDFLLNK